MKVGKWKTEVNFTLNRKVYGQESQRCLVMYKDNFVTMPLQEAKSLWLQIGVSLGINEKRVRQALDMVPYDDRPPD